MKAKTYRVRLTGEARKCLQDITRKGNHPGRQIVRAAILLSLDERREGTGEWVPAPKAGAYRCGINHVYTVRRQYVKEGIERALNRKQRETPPVPSKI